MSVISIAGGSSTASSAGGGKIYGYNNIATSPQVVAQANPQRQKITFHNPGTNDIFVGPSYIQNVLGTAPTQPSNVAFAPTTTNYGGCFRVYANGGTLTISGECQGAWQALATTGSTNQLTVMESNT